MGGRKYSRNGDASAREATADGMPGGNAADASHPKTQESQTSTVVEPPKAMRFMDNPEIAVPTPGSTRRTGRPARGASRGCGRSSPHLPVLETDMESDPIHPGLRDAPTARIAPKDWAKPPGRSIVPSQQTSSKPAMSPPESNVGVILPVSRAFDRTQKILFRPFDLYRWLAIGFTAWLASLGENWSGGGGGGGGSGRGGARGLDSFDPEGLWDEAQTYVADNFTWLVPTVILGLLVVFALGLLVIWLSSRGRFMFLHNVVLDRAEVVAPWHGYRRQGNSLFLFRTVLSLTAFVVSLPLLVLAGMSAFTMIGRQSVSAGPLALAVGSGLALAVLGLVFLLVEKMTKDFVVPIMWMRQPSCLAAWREFGSLLRAVPGLFVLYILFHILLTVSAAILIFGLVLVTCCVAGCLFALPYLGTVFLLPVFVFFRSYSLLYLAQYGPDYDVFRSPAPQDPAAASAGS